MRCETNSALRLALAYCVLSPLVHAQQANTIEPGSVRAVFLVTPEPPRILFDLEQASPRDLNRYIQTQVVLIKSRMVLNAVLRDPKVAALPIVKAESSPFDWLERRLTVTGVPEHAVLEISMRGGDRA